MGGSMPTHPPCSRPAGEGHGAVGTLRFSHPTIFSPNAVAGEFLGDVGLNRLGRGNVLVAPCGIVGPDLGNATAVEGGWPVRLDPQRGVIVGNGFARLPRF